MKNTLSPPIVKSQKPLQVKVYSRKQRRHSVMREHFAAPVIARSETTKQSPFPALEIASLCSQ
jgi:hypothetical protein